MDDFQTFYRTQYTRVMSGCVALCSDVDVARDATDEAFARAFARWRTVGQMTAPGGWVQVVALNRVRRLRGRARLDRLLPHTQPRSEAPVDLPDAELWAAVRRLPPRQQTAVALRYLHDLPEAAVAAAMGVSRGAVSASLSTARSRLRLYLDPEPDKETLHD